MYYVLADWTIYPDCGAGAPKRYRKSFSTWNAAMEYVRRNQPGGDGPNKYAKA